MVRRAPLLAALLYLAASGAAIADAPSGAPLPDSTPEQVPGKFIIRWKAGVRRRPIDRVGRHFVVSSRDIGPRSTVFELNERSLRASREARDALGASAREDIAEVVPVHYRYPTARIVPNDPWYRMQWHLKTVNLELAWGVTQGSKTKYVAVVDTGILFDHPDFTKGRLMKGYDFVSDTTSSKDGDGWDTDAADPGDSSPSSSGLHGTHVAGIIAAASNNKVGVTGVDWNCYIVPVRALGATDGGRGEDSDISAAIRWAAGASIPGVPDIPHPADVINLSFGAEGDNTELRAAVQEAQQLGAIVVAAAGNMGVDARKTFPAAYPNVITVGATDFSNGVAAYSNFGTTVKIMAPGGQSELTLPGTTSTDCDGKPCQAGIYSLYRMGTTWGYYYLEGTSQAAPIVTGVVSLMLGVNPSLGVADVMEILKETANHDAMCKEGCGAGLLDAYGAVAAAYGAPVENQTRVPDWVKPDTVMGSCSIGGPGTLRAALPLGLLLGLVALRRRRRAR
jgi:MYXO-CTERM domain-containing protein